MISQEELLADMLTNKVGFAIDTTDKIGAHFIFLKEYGVNKSVHMFNSDLTKIYHGLLREYYIECANLRYGNCKDKHKILNYKLHKFLSYYKTPEYKILNQSHELKLKDFSFRLEQFEFYFKDKDGFNINFATINLLVLICNGINYYLPADKEDNLIKYLCGGDLNEWFTYRNHNQTNK